MGHITLQASDETDGQNTCLSGPWTIGIGQTVGQTSTWPIGQPATCPQEGVWRRRAEEAEALA